MKPGRAILIVMGLRILGATAAYAEAIPNMQEDAKFDWARLEAAHVQALALTKQADDTHKGAGTVNAVEMMKSAGALNALHAPLGGFSAKRAAAILNDFGFLDNYDLDVSEKFYRRAIELDPNRKVAYLNLANLLYAELPWASRWPEKEQRAREAAEDYRKYIALGGSSTPKVESFLEGDLGRNHPGTICEITARYANAGRLEELVSERADGVMTEDGIQDLSFEYEGTANAPTIKAFESGTTKAVQPPTLPPGTLHLWGGDHLGLLVYHDDSYILYYRDGRHPVSMKALAPGAKVPTCIFSVRTVEAVGATAREQGLCAKRQRGPKASTPAVDSFANDDQAVAPSLEDVKRAADKATGAVTPGIRFATKATMSADAVYAKHYKSVELGSALVAFTNDGVFSNVGRFHFSSGAGAGCDKTFFDVLNAKGTAFVEGSRSKLIDELQGTDLNGRYRMRCDNNPRFFEFEGKVYFEDRPAEWPPVDARDEYHRVARVSDGKVEDVCDFGFQTVITGRPK